MANKRFDKAFVLKQLQDYYDEGHAVLDKGRTDRDKADAVWNMIYLNDVPKDSIYYPTSRAYGNYINRSITKAFSQANDIAIISPSRKKASDVEAFIAKRQNDLFNARVSELQDDIEVFLDDSSISSVKHGTGISKVFWLHEEGFEEFQEEEMVMNEETGIEEPVMVTKERRIVFENRPVMEALKRDELIWDTGAKKWRDARWAMQVKIERTASQVRMMIETDDFDTKEVKRMLDSKSAKTTSFNDGDEQITKAEDNMIFELNEFWGEIRLNENDDEVTFAKIVADSDFKHLLLTPKTGREHLYFWLNKKPMIPYTVGYILPREGEVEGDSLMLLARPLQGEENYMRNGIRRSTELALNPMYVLRKGAGLDSTQIKDRTAGAFVWTTEDVRTAAAQFPHRDQSPPGYNDLALLDTNYQMVFGANKLAMGIVDPGAIPETAFATNLISNSANQSILSIIERYNNTLFEPTLYKMMVLSLQFTTEDQMKNYGVNIPPEAKDLILSEVELRIDAGLGATSELAHRANLTQANFLLQQGVKYTMDIGFVPTIEQLMGPLEVLRDQLPTLGVKNAEHYIPPVEEIVANTQKFEQAKQQNNQKMQQEGDSIVQGEVDNAKEQGRMAFEEQMQGAGQGGQAQ